MTITPIKRPTGGSLTRQFARSAAGTKPDAQTIADAYVYLLGRALVIRQEHFDLDGTGADYNVIEDTPLGAPDGVNPNFDVASVGNLCVRDAGLAGEGARRCRTDRSAVE